MKYFISLKKQWIKVEHLFYRHFMTKKISKCRRNESSVDLDEQVPDERHNHTDFKERIVSVALRILECLDYLARKHDFEYFLAYGSLLGAVRHHGYIPWDDDLDIMMTERSVEKLIAVSNELPSSIIFFPMYKNFLKLMDAYSVISKDGKRGVAVDIFVVKELPNGKIRFRTAHGYHQIYLEASDIWPLKDVKFEDRQLPIPCNPDKMLTAIYGDYMTLPPEAERVYSHTNEDIGRILPFGQEPERKGKWV